jgi:electron transport complex protein RnfG
MEKLESSFKNMVLSLVTICLVAGGALAAIYSLTTKTIETQKEQKLQAAILQVLPEGTTISEAEQVKGMTVYKGYIDGEWVGTAVETEEVGFGGTIKIMVGFDADSKVINYQVLEHQETPGLGDKMGTWFKTDKGNQRIIGKTANGAFTVSKDGGDIDAITAATISSRAFLKAINKAYEAFTNGEVQAISGATQQSNEEKEMEVTNE